MFIARSILRAPTDGAPEGNGAAPAPSQSALPLDGQQPAPPAAPAEPAKPKIDPSDPELRKLVQAAAKKAAEEAAAAERAKIEEEKIAAAVCTPIRDLRDEVWVRVYAQVYAESHRVDLATFHADKAVERMPVPAHRRAEVASATDLQV